MTVRVAFTVALAVALLAASVPAIDAARVQHSEARVTTELQRLDREATALAAENDAVAGGRPASARVTLHLPSRSWGERGLEEFRILPGCVTRDVVWRVRGGTTQSYRASPVPVAGPTDGLVIGDGGRYRLVLELRRQRGRRVVVARRPASNSGA